MAVGDKRESMNVVEKIVFLGFVAGVGFVVGVFAVSVLWGIANVLGWSRVAGLLSEGYRVPAAFVSALYVGKEIWKGPERANAGDTP